MTLPYTIAEVDDMIEMYRVMARSKRASDDQRREAMEALYRYSSMRAELLFRQAK